MDESLRRHLALGILALVTSACSSSSFPAAPTAAPLFRAQPLAMASLTPSPTAAVVPSPGIPTTLPQCQNDARFVADVTIPDGTIVGPGEAIDKRWSVINAGTCDWSAGYRLVRVGAGAIEGVGELALYPARAGSTAEWQVTLRAPEVPGEYLARWRARAPDGSLFGEEVFVLIFVEEPTGVPSPTVSPTASR